MAEETLPTGLTLGEAKQNFLFYLKGLNAKRRK